MKNILKHKKILIFSGIIFVLIMIFYFIGQKNYLHVTVIDTKEQSQISWSVLTRDNSIISVGYSGNYLMSDALIVKTDKLGKILWEKQVTGNFNDKFHSLIPLSDGNFLAIGSTDSNDGSFQTSLGESDGIIYKFNPNGDLIWMQRVGGSKRDRLFSAIELEDGSIIAVGSTNSNDLDITTREMDDRQDGMIVKLDKDGNKIWVNIFYGNDSDTLNFIKQTNDGNVIIIGETQSTSFMNEDESNIQHLKLAPEKNSVLIKMNLLGEIIQYKVLDIGMFTHIEDILETSDHHFIVTGYFVSNYNATHIGFMESGLSNDDGFIYKINQDLEVVQFKHVDHEDFKEEFNTIIMTKNNDYLLVGSKASLRSIFPTASPRYDTWIVKMDRDFNIIDSKLYDVKETTNFHQILNLESGYIVMGNQNEYTEKNKVIFVKFLDDLEILK